MLHHRPASLRRTLIVSSGLALLLAAGLVSVQSFSSEPNPNPIEFNPQEPGDAAAPSSAAPDYDSTKAYTYADQMPEFNGSVNEWLAQHLRYPEAARKRGKGGRVIVKFIVDAAGTVTEPKVIHSADPELDAEALRVVSAMPAWKPGRNKGQAVPVYFNMPIVFRLE